MCSRWLRTDGGIQDWIFDWISETVPQYGRPGPQDNKYNIHWCVAWNLILRVGVQKQYPRDSVPSDPNPSLYLVLCHLHPICQGLHKGLSAKCIQQGKKSCHIVKQMKMVQYAKIARSNDFVVRQIVLGIGVVTANQKDLQCLTKDESTCHIVDGCLLRDAQQSLFVDLAVYLHCLQLVLMRLVPWKLLFEELLKVLFHRVSLFSCSYNVALTKLWVIYHNW